MSRLKQLGKDSVVYGIGGIFAKSVTFLVLPIYTRLFSPSEYGAIEMLTVISSFLGALLVMGMDAAQSFYFYKVKNQGKQAQAELVTAILQWRLLWGLSIVLIATLFAPLLNNVFFDSALSWEYFAIAFAGSLFIQVMNQSAEVMRLLYRPWKYIFIMISQSILATSLILIFTLLLDAGLKGYFWGTTIASACIGVLGWFNARDYLSFNKLHTSQWPKLIRFGAPLLPAGMAVYFMSSADRWFIQYYHGQDVLGLFAVGAKFGAVAMVAIELFRKAAFPLAMDAINSGDEKLFYQLTLVYFGIASIGTLFLTLVSPVLVNFVVPSEYFEAWIIVGIVSWQFVFWGYFMISGPGLWRAEKTYLRAYVMGIASVVGVILNYFFVPAMGYIGAAISTALTYFFCLVIMVLVSRKYWEIPLPFFLVAKYLAIGVLGTGYLICYALPGIDLSDIIIVTSLSIYIGVSLWLQLKKSLEY